MAKHVKVVDKGWNRIAKDLKKTSRGRAASVGIQGNLAEIQAPEHGGKTNVEIGVYQEYGSKDPPNRPPERSYLRSTFDEELSKYERQVQKISKDFFKLGASRVDGELLLLGEEAKRDVINKIKSSIPPELAESTKRLREKKGETKFTPLIFTSQLVNSLSVEVVNRATKEKESGP